MAVSFKSGLRSMCIEVAPEQYLLAWASHTAHVRHAHQTYDIGSGSSSYVENHLMPVADSAFSQGLHDRKLAARLQEIDKSLSPAVISALLGAVGLLHDLKEDTDINCTDKVLESFREFRFANCSMLVSSATVAGDESTFVYKDNDLFAFPHDFGEYSHRLMQDGAQRYVLLVDAALSLLSKEEGMSYDQYREKLLTFKPQTASDHIAWLLALCVKAHDSQNNYLNCLNTGKYSWGLKYVKNLQLVLQTLSELKN